MDIVERLRKLVILDEVGSDNPLGREAADEIERLQRVQETLIAAFRINMMRLSPEYTHEEFDKAIAEFKEKE